VAVAERAEERLRRITIEARNVAAARPADLR
jgi:hypothetical protein